MECTRDDVWRWLQIACLSIILVLLAWWGINFFGVFESREIRETEYQLHSFRVVDDNRTYIPIRLIELNNPELVTKNVPLNTIKIQSDKNNSYTKALITQKHRKILKCVIIFSDERVVPVWKKYFGLE